MSARSFFLCFSARCNRRVKSSHKKMVNDDEYLRFTTYDHFFLPHSSDSSKLVVPTSIFQLFFRFSFFNFQNIRFTFDSFLTTSLSFLLSTLATSNRCCNFHGITVMSFTCTLFSQFPKRYIKISFHPA